MDKKYNVLVVDDDSNNVQLAVNILKQNKDYNIIFATTGANALKRVKEYDFDIIVLDILMEPMNGYEVCQELKKDPKTKDIPVIFLTAKNDEESISKGFELGGVDYITKPFFEKEFISRVSTHLELKIFRDKLIDEIELKDKLMFQQNKMATMGEMIDNIVHQWRQPLSIITTIASSLIMEKTMGFENKQKTDIESLEDIISTVEHLSQTINDFKDFLRPKDKTKFSIDNIVDRTISLISKNIEHHDIEVQNEIEPISIEGYENELIQVIINILNNAVDVLETAKVRKIVIKSKIDNDNIKIFIQDTGGGIEQSIINDIFNQNFTTKSDEKGTGIGLYMSRKIITEHFNGDISVENDILIIDDTEYKGAKFIINIPIFK